MADTLPHPADATQEIDLSGRDVGNFRLLRRLGRGAMAEVYLAEQASLRRQVAVKVLKSNLAGDESYVRRFHNEAQAAASLVHANIVQIHEVGCVDGVHYIAQEYVQGQNLREWLVRRGPPDAKLSLQVMRQVAAALTRAAERGIVHRDIKPENIMLARSGEVKVADFGLARLTGADGAVNLTQVGVTMGTPLYMSPEQVEGRSLDPRSDIYSLGVTCYHMLSGAPPFRGETALSVAVQHLKSQPERLENLRPDLPPGLCRIVHKMLAKDPNDRYQHPRELLQDLRSVRVEAGEGEPLAYADDLSEGELESLAASHEATERLSTIMRATRLPAKKWPWVVVGLLAAFAIGGATAWALREPFLLADAHPDTIPLEKTARDQLYVAMSMGTEDSLKSVEKNFPNDRYEVHRAQQELARLYLRNNRLEEALVLFDMFAAMDESERELRAFGLAGRNVVMSLQGNVTEATKAFAELLPLQEALSNDRQMLDLVSQFLIRNRRAVNEEAIQKFQALEKRLEAADATDAEENAPGN